MISFNLLLNRQSKIGQQMIDTLIGMLAPKSRALTSTEIESVIGNLRPGDLADLFDMGAGDMQPTGLDPLAKEAADALFHRCGPAIDEIFRVMTGASLEAVSATNVIVKAACAHQALMATFPGLSFEQVVQVVLKLVVARAKKTSALLSNQTQRH
jgi:hypothetical protein